jgi:lysyl-tRNA synthetase class 2
MEPINELMAIRKEKERQLRELGIETYPQVRGDYKTTEEVKRAFGELGPDELERIEDTPSLAGRIISLRDFGKSIFMHIQDRKGKIQVYIRRDRLKEPAYDICKRVLDIGDIISVSGRVFKTKTGELTILAESLMLLTKSLRPLPEKWHGLKDVEERYRRRYLDLIVNERVREIFIKRSRIIRFIRNFLEEGIFRGRDTHDACNPGGAVQNHLSPITMH